MVLPLGPAERSTLRARRGQTQVERELILPSLPLQQVCTEGETQAITVLCSQIPELFVKLGRSICYAFGQKFIIKWKLFPSCLY